MASLAVLDDDDGTLEPPLRRSSRWYAAMQRRSALFSCAFYVDTSMLAERHDGHRLQLGSASDDPLVVVLTGPLDYQHRCSSTRK